MPCNAYAIVRPAARVLLYVPA